MNRNRARLLKAGTRTSGPVIYWMSRDQRVRDNWALLCSQEIALQQHAPVAVIFCVVPRFLDASVRQYGFMLKGLREVEKDMAEKNIPFLLLYGSPEEQIPTFIEKHRAGTLVTDFDPLSIKRTWKAAVATKISCPLYEVDAHNIVPCWLASPKQEYAAYTFRPKLKRAVPEFLDEYSKLQEHPHEWRDVVANEWDSIVKTLPVDQTVPEVNWLKPGEAAAQQILHEFLEQKLPVYPDQRNDPNKAVLSNLSPYLHFGQIAAQRVALDVHRSDTPPDSKAAFLEELIVRRELSDNYCFYNPGYESFDGLPEWAQKTLHVHAKDRREYQYTREELERAETQDPYWNAAQNEMVLRGKMHGYMRMYWGKKIIEWSSTPEEAFETALYLNNIYELDGRDPNGYAGVAWCFGTHDRPWPERPIFGKIRYMNANGLKRKFDVERYVRTIGSHQWKNRKVR
jgi:deoxyribodipyrimidine photo-lyase